MSVSVGKYKLLRRIAVGGMAEIFLARVHGEAGFHRKVIIKKILPHYAGEPEFVRRLVDEGLLAARLSHGNIVQVLDLGRLGPDYFIAMEFVDGVDARHLLSSLFDHDTIVPPEIGVHILWQVSRALAYAHDKRSARGEPLNIVHRDISPANVFISWEGAVKLGDFGIAKASQRLTSHTMSGVLQGKFPYMSPEQASGADLEQTSDVFSFGSVAYELLTQQRPFDGESDIMVMARVKEASPRPIRELRPDLPEAFADIVHTCLTADTSQRYANGVELERAIARVVQENGWVVSEGDVATFLSDLYGKEKAPEDPDVAVDPDEEGEVLEASPLDPYDLRAGMPTPARRTTPPPTEEFTQAVSQPDWRKRQTRRQRGWLAWLGVLAVLAFLLVLDYTTTHLVLRPGGTPVPTAANTVVESPPDGEVATVPAADIATASEMSDTLVPGDVVALPDVQGFSVEALVSPPDSIDLAPSPDVSPTVDTTDVVAVETVESPGDVVPADLAQEVAPRRNTTHLLVIPEDTQIFANGKLLGASPQNLTLIEGQRPLDVRLERDGYESSSFSLGYPGPRRLAKRLQAIPTGRIVLRYTPASATVLIDQREFSGKGGLNIIEAELTAGAHTIIVRDGERETSKSITVQEGQEWRGTITVPP